MSTKIPKLRDRLKNKQNTATLPTGFDIKRVSMPNIVTVHNTGSNSANAQQAQQLQAQQPLSAYDASTKPPFHTRHISSGAYDQLSELQRHAVVTRAAQLKQLMSSAVNKTSATRRQSRLLLAQLNTLTYDNNAADISTINEELNASVDPVYTGHHSHAGSAFIEPTSPTSRYTLDMDDELEIQRIIAENELDDMDEPLSPVTYTESRQPSLTGGQYEQSVLFSGNSQRYSLSNLHGNPLSPVRSRSVNNQANMSSKPSTTRHSAAYVKKLYDELKQKERDVKLAAQLGQTLVDDNTSLAETVEQLQKLIDQQSEQFTTQTATLNNELEQLRIQNLQLMQSQTRVRSDSDATNNVLTVLSDLLQADLLHSNNENVTQQYIPTGDITTDINSLYRKQTYERRYVQSLLAALNEQVSTLTEQNEQLQSRANQYDVEKLQSQINELNTANILLQQRVVDTKAELESQYKQSVRQQQKHHSTMVQQLQSDVQSERQRNNDLVQQLNVMQHQYDAMLTQQQVQIEAALNASRSAVRVNDSMMATHGSMIDISTDALGVDIGVNTSTIATDTNGTSMSPIHASAMYESKINEEADEHLDTVDVLQLTPQPQKTKHTSSNSIANLQSMYNMLDHAKQLLTDTTPVQQQSSGVTAMSPAQQSIDRTAFDELLFVLQRPGRELSVVEQGVLRHVFKLLQTQWLLALTLLPSDRNTRPAQWMRDESRDECMTCSSEFTMLRRRHHCRLCGNLYCNACSVQRVTVAKYMFVGERVCSSCYTISDHVQTQLARPNSATMVQ